MRVKKIIFLIFLIAFSGCVADKGKIEVSLRKKDSHSTMISANISAVQIVNDQLIITGTGLNNISTVKVSGDSLNQNFTIESKSNSQIIANAINAFSFDMSKAFSLMISDAQGSANFPIDFSLCNATLNGKGFNCAAPVADKDVLAYDGISKTWKPRPASGLNYLGTFDASPGVAPTAQPAGAYYVINDHGTIATVNFEVGDWIVSNGPMWQKIDNSTAVLSVFGRNSAITAEEGDYTLDLLGDVNLPGTPAVGKVLKFDGTNWVAGDDLSGGGAGSVVTTALADGAVTDVKITSVSASKITGTINSTQILDGTIVNADINAAAAIDYSKLNIPNTTIPYAKLNIANGDIPATKISGLPAVTTVLTTTITDNDATHAPDGNAVFEALGLKLNLAGGSLTGGGTISNVPDPVAPDDVANRSFVDTKIAKAGGTMSGDLNLETSLNLKGATNYVTLKAGGATAAYTLTLPLNAGTNGQVLTTNGASPAILTWTTPSAGGAGTVTSVTGSGPISVTNTTTTPAITIATANTTTTGVLSSADWNTFNSKATNTLADGSIFIGNSSNVATANAVTGDVTITNAGVTTIGANKILDSHIAANTVAPSKLSGARSAAKYLRGDDIWADLVADVRDVTLGTVTPTSGAPYSPVSTGDTISVAFNKTQGQLNYVAANAITKDGTNFLTGSTAIQGITARLTVPTPLIANLDDATNVQYVSSAIAAIPTQWTESGGNLTRATGQVGIGFTPWNAFGIYRANAEAVSDLVSDNTSTNTARYPTNRILNFAGSPANGAVGNPSISLINLRGTTSTSAPIQSGEALGALSFNGGTNVNGSYGEGASIWGTATENYTSTANGGNLSFYTTANATKIPKVRMLIDQTGYVGLNTVAPNTTLDINGAMSMRGMAAPAVSPSGEGRIYFDSTAKKFKSSIDGAAYTDLVAPAFPLQGTNGTSSLPTYSFASDTDTGMYLANSNQLAFATGGTQRLRIQDQSFYLGNLGSSGANASTFGFDSRYTGNSGFTSTGRFGITTSLSFTVPSSATVPGMNSTFYLSGDQDTGGYVGAGHFRFYSGTTGLFTGNGYGVRGSISSSAGAGNSTGQQSAVIGAIEMIGAAGLPTFTNVSAVRAQFNLSGVAAGGTRITTASSFESTVVTAVNDMIDTWYGILIKAPTGAGTVTTKYAMVTEPGAGNVGIGTLTPAYTLDVNGTVAGTSAYQVSSDARFKKDITKIKSALERLTSLDGVYYFFRNEEFPEKNFSHHREMGVIAQTVEKTFPEAVSTDNKGFKTVAYTMLIAPVIESLKEIKTWLIGHDTELANQKRELASVKAQNSKLMQENAAIKSYLCSKDPKASICK
jgi:hypothetical protein